MYLLDTNIVSVLVRDPQGLAARRVSDAGEGNVACSIVVAAEIRFGLALKGSALLTRQTERVLATLPVLALEEPAEQHYARIRAELQRRGTPIGANDLFIAAHALSLGATLVTDNVREFERVDGLVVENWLRA